MVYSMTLEFGPIDLYLAIGSNCIHNIQSRCMNRSLGTSACSHTVQNYRHKLSVTGLNGEWFVKIQYMTTVSKHMQLTAFVEVLAWKQIFLSCTESC